MLKSRNGPRQLALGIARVAPPPEQTIGSAGFALAVKAAVEAELRDGGMSPADAEVAIVNVPQPTSGDVGVRGRKGQAAAALGAGLALGEIAAESVREDAIVSDGSLYTARVQTFTGPAIPDIEIIVIGNAPGRGGDLFACNTITTDLLDVRPVKRMLVEAGLRLDADGELDTSRLVATLAKLGVDPSGRVSGAPTTIFNSVTPPEKHVRAALLGALGATLHTTRLFSTFDPVQQAPIGGGTVCSYSPRHRAIMNYGEELLDLNCTVCSQSATHDGDAAVAGTKQENPHCWRRPCRNRHRPLPCPQWHRCDAVRHAAEAGGGSSRRDAAAINSGSVRGTGPDPSRSSSRDTNPATFSGAIASGTGVRRGIGLRAGLPEISGRPHVIQLRAAQERSIPH